MTLFHLIWICAVLCSQNSPDKLDCLKAVSKDVVAALVAGSCPEVTTPSTPSDSAPAAASQAPEVDVEKVRG